MVSMLFSFKPAFNLCLYSPATVAEDSIQQNTSLILCPRHPGAQQQLRDEQEHLPDYTLLLETAEGLQIITSQVMQRGILGQYRGARDALYGLPLSPLLAHDLL
jgi:hypothetical protein